VTRIVGALAILAIWLAITVLGGALLSPRPESLLGAVTDQVGWSFLLASMFLLAIIPIAGLRDTGLRGSYCWRDIPLLWLPSLYIAGFLGVATQLGLPPMPVMATILLNCALVGLSEELMFRGVLLGAFRGAAGTMTAVIASTLIFGAVHSLNVFVIGDLGAALVQSGAAFISGLMFAALRIRLGSIWPGVLVHTLWNFGTFLMLAAGDGALLRSAPTDAPPLLAYLVPLVLVAPNGLYALWLLRARCPD
jgi:membrane protease YdiL (CAAX protease family)